MNDIYLLEFEPHLLSHKQEELGLVFADLDTAVDLMKKEEKVLIAELTLYYVEKGGYKNMTELMDIFIRTRNLRITLIDTR